jgi:hypothetical protein
MRIGATLSATSRLICLAGTVASVLAMAGPAHAVGALVERLIEVGAVPDWSGKYRGR